RPTLLSACRDGPARSPIASGKRAMGEQAEAVCASARSWRNWRDCCSYWSGASSARQRGRRDGRGAQGRAGEGRGGGPDLADDALLLPPWQPFWAKRERSNRDYLPYKQSLLLVLPDQVLSLKTCPPAVVPSTQQTGLIERERAGRSKIEPRRRGRAA